MYLPLPMKKKRFTAAYTARRNLTKKISIDSTKSGTAYGVSQSLA